MKDTVTIGLTSDQLFREGCNQFNVKYTCVQENIDSNRYEIEFQKACDILAIGTHMGIELMHKQITE